MFHEFGHALHGLFADQQYPSLSGTNVARDFVELPSQFNEHWALEPTVLAHYAVHHKTGAPMPQALADKIKKAATFNQGYSLTEILGAAELDMRWHSLPAGSPEQTADAFEAAALEAVGPRPAPGAAALPLQLLPAHLGERLRGRLLRLPVGGDARQRRVRVVQGARRADAGQRRPVPRHDPVARQRRRLREAVPGVPRDRTRTSSRCSTAGGSGGSRRTRPTEAWGQTRV